MEDLSSYIRSKGRKMSGEVMSSEWLHNFLHSGGEAHLAAGKG
jgi:hypothetical protein